MLCEKCHKREAIVHITGVIDGQAKTQNLCAPCSEEISKDSPKDIRTSGWTSYGPGDVRFDKS